MTWLAKRKKNRKGIIADKNINIQVTYLKIPADFQTSV